MQPRTYGSVARVQLVEETLVPSVDAVLQNIADDVEQAVLALTPVGQGQVELGGEVVWLVGVDEDVLRLARDMAGERASGPMSGGVIGRANIGDDELSNGLEELKRSETHRTQC